MMEDEFSYHLDRAVRSAQMLRFVENHFRDDEDVYRTFTGDSLVGAAFETRYSFEFSNRVADEAGFFDAFDAYAREIAAGLAAVDLPDADRDLLRDMGSPNPEVELRSLAHRAKSWLETDEMHFREVRILKRLQQVEKRLETETDEFKAYVESKKKEQEVTSKQVGRKPRRWFKALGQIGQGAALSIADVAMAIGTLHLPVSPETRTWGAIASVTTGIGTVLSGVGDLRSE
jgi:hypothetical protein